MVVVLVAVAVVAANKTDSFPGLSLFVALYPYIQAALLQQS